MAYDKPLSDFGDEDHREIMTVEEFLRAVECTAYTDYDGDGYPVKGGMVDNTVVILASCCPECIPEDAEEILWFNQ